MNSASVNRNSSKKRANPNDDDGFLALVQEILGQDVTDEDLAPVREVHSLISTTPSHSNSQQQRSRGLFSR